MTNFEKKFLRASKALTSIQFLTGINTNIKEIKKCRN